MNRYRTSRFNLKQKSFIFSRFLGDLHLFRLWKVGSTQEGRFYIWIQVLRRSGPELIASTPTWTIKIYQQKCHIHVKTATWLVSHPFDSLLTAYCIKKIIIKKKTSSEKKTTKSSTVDPSRVIVCSNIFFPSRFFSFWLNLFI